ncbi:hypothetical protein SUGI_0853050 [Cryptomeria japonica]|nr:hypothetical protein SUGI_0853050 [Cryptomeria japonica]
MDWNFKLALTNNSWNDLSRVNAAGEFEFDLSRNFREELHNRVLSRTIVTTATEGYLHRRNFREKQQDDVSAREFFLEEEQRTALTE